MAERRMFSKTIIDSDLFLDMPLTTQALYFHLSMRADDEGFINNPKRIQRTIGASDDDLKLLIAKQYLIPFDTGVVVVRHWKIHNYIQSDRKKATQCIEEKSHLKVENGVYTMDTDRIHDGYSLDTQDRLGKDSIGEDRLGKDKKPSPAAAVEAVIADSGLTDEVKDAFRDFAESRRQMRAPLTEKAAKLLLGKLIKMTDSTEERIAIINQSVENGWKGFFELKRDRQDSQTKGEREQQKTVDMLKKFMEGDDEPSGIF